MSQKLSILVVVGLVIIGAVGYWLWRVEQPTEGVASTLPGTQDIPEGAQVVTLTEDGFVPSQLSIRVGDTVTFKTTNGDLFWPASNLHPSHGIYPEFDPLGPVQPTHVWSFTFDKAGEWKYHDHLAPYYTGVITVTE